MNVLEVQARDQRLTPCPYLENFDPRYPTPLPRLESSVGTAFYIGPKHPTPRPFSEGILSLMKTLRMASGRWEVVSTRDLRFGRPTLVEVEEVGYPRC
eukprot:scaffold107263_cov43-Cyclotella_meneghiniana.AAC.1